MDTRIPRLRRKLARVPYVPWRSRSFGEERHRFRLGPRLSDAEVAAFETEHHVELHSAYRDFLLAMGGSGASPFYGLLPLEDCGFFTMDPREPGTHLRGFHRARPRVSRGDLFLHVIERGCSDLVLVGVTGPLSGRVLTGNADGFWGPNVSSAPDFLAWYERWLDHMTAGRHNEALSLTAPHPAHVPVKSTDARVRSRAR
ncbi:MAG: SMI1/KNR4 family protein [Streptomycetaceae bacterium]|nr:SMI1/KNR4 family protein [Streptomycetaceae bacterium]